MAKPLSQGYWVMVAGTACLGLGKEETLADILAKKNVVRNVNLGVHFHSQQKHIKTSQTGARYGLLFRVAYTRRKTEQKWAQ